MSRRKRRNTNQIIAALRADFPKVFKLSAGAASNNVKLARTRDDARKLCKSVLASTGICVRVPLLSEMASQ